jgi:hypothetical protein
LIKWKLIKPIPISAVLADGLFAIVENESKNYIGHQTDDISVAVIAMII